MKLNPWTDLPHCDVCNAAAISYDISMGDEYTTEAVASIQFACGQSYTGEVNRSVLHLDAQDQRSSSAFSSMTWGDGHPCQNATKVARELMRIESNKDRPTGT